jgi:hypothetical protein
MATDDTNTASPSSSRFTPESGSGEKTRVISRNEQEDGFELDDLGKGRTSNDEDEEQVPSHSGEDDFTEAEEKRVLKKLDRRVVLFVALLYLLSFLDRSNIGNARIAGLERDLWLSSEQYEWLLTAFYISYILFEWMALLYVSTFYRGQYYYMYIYIYMLTSAIASDWFRHMST